MCYDVSIKEFNLQLSPSDSPSFSGPLAFHAPLLTSFDVAFPIGYQSYVKNMH